MENASKALTIAGGLLITVLVITLVVGMYNQIKVWQNSKIDNSSETAFNASFEAFNRSGVYGSELFSLINKVIDYNRDESETDNYSPITITIKCKTEHTYGSSSDKRCYYDYSTETDPNLFNGTLKKDTYYYSYIVPSITYTSDLTAPANTQIALQINKLEKDIERTNAYCKYKVQKSAVELSGMRTNEWKTFIQQYNDKFPSAYKCSDVNKSDKLTETKDKIYHELVEPYVNFKIMEQQIKQTKFDVVPDSIVYGSTGRIEKMEFIEE